MIKQTISFTDYNGTPTVEDHYFHATKAELLDHLDIKPQLEELSRRLEGDNGEVRDLREDEVMDILNLVKRLVRLSFGQRSKDGKNFYKGDDIWREFESSAAYDAMLFALFENPEKAFAFMSGIMPKDLLEQAEAQAKLDGPPARPVPQDRLQKAVKVATPETKTEEVTFEDEGVVEESKADRLRRELAELEAAESVETPQG